jgi:hypothetical protein
MKDRMSRCNSAIRKELRDDEGLSKNNGYQTMEKQWKKLRNVIERTQDAAPSKRA